MKRSNLKMVLGIFLSLALMFTGCSDDEYNPSELTGLTEFGFLANDLIPGLENLKFTIDQTSKKITNEDELPYGTDVSKLVAVFEAIELTTVTVNGNDVVSGTTELDYTKGVDIVVTAEDGVTKEIYHVEIKISTVNPNLVQWSLANSSIVNFDYQTVRAAFFKGKYYAIFGTVGSIDKPVAYTEYMSSEDGINWTKIDIDESTFPIGCKHSLVVFNDKLWVCGYAGVGMSWGKLQPISKNEFWVSDDGKTFTQHTPTFCFHEMTHSRIDPFLLDFNNNLWAICGYNCSMGGWNHTKGPDSPLEGPSLCTDISTGNSSDMQSWNEPFLRRLPKGKVGEYMTPWGQPEECARRYAGNVVHNGKIYLIGGQIAGGYISNLIWTTSDGENWEVMQPSGLTPRMGATALSLNGNLYLIGGQTGVGECQSEILVSKDDGATWAQADEEMQFPEGFKARAGQSIVMDDEGNTLIIGGYYTTRKPGDDNWIPEDTHMLKDVWKGKVNIIKE